MSNHRLATLLHLPLTPPACLLYSAARLVSLLAAKGDRQRIAPAVQDARPDCRHLVTTGKDTSRGASSGGTAGCTAGPGVWPSSHWRPAAPCQPAPGRASRPRATG